MKLSVLYLVNLPSPYRVSFFNELGQYCDLTVIFERYQADNREKGWHDYNFKNFNGEFLSGLKIGDDSTFDLSLLKMLKKHYDIVVIGNYSTPSGMIAINYLKISKTPFIINVDGGIIDDDESFLKKRLKTYLISSASSWLSTGKNSNEYLKYYGANEDHINIYPFTTLNENSIISEPISFADKEKIKTELKIPYNNIIISVGRFITSKGFDLLIKSAENLNGNTGVYIIGGNITKEYEEIIQTKKISNVHFINFLSYDSLKKYYQAANVFVFPTREDVWGLVINEAMANALPVVTTTNCVAGLEMIEEGINGYLVPVEDVELLTLRTNEILDNQELQLQMAQNNINKSYDYTIEKMAEKTFKIFLDVYEQQ